MCIRDGAHADLLVEDLLQLFGQRDVLYRQALDGQADLGKVGRQLFGQRVGKHHPVSYPHLTLPTKCIV